MEYVCQGHNDYVSEMIMNNNSGDFYSTIHAMKFRYKQSDQISNIFTKFDQNPTHNKRDISRKSGTDTDTHRQTDRQIDEVGRSHSLPDCDIIMIINLRIINSSRKVCLKNT